MNIAETELMMPWAGLLALSPLKWVSVPWEQKSPGKPPLSPAFPSFLVLEVRPTRGGWGLSRRRI